MSKNLKCIQINLHHAKAASDVLSRKFINSGIHIGFIQEPWAYKGGIQGLPTTSCKLVYSKKHESPRAALLLNKSINYLPIPEFISRDLVAAAVEVPTTGGKQEVIFASAYFPGESDDPPPRDVQRLIQHCKRNNKHIIMGCDANAHHVVWGSTDTNTRGEYLLEYLSTNNIDILNEGNKPTFVNVLRQAQKSKTGTYQPNPLYRTTTT